MNVFENPADPNPCCGGGYVFGSFWGVPDLATTLDGGANKSLFSQTSIPTMLMTDSGLMVTVVVTKSWMPTSY